MGISCFPAADNNVSEVCSLDDSQSTAATEERSEIYYFEEFEDDVSVQECNDSQSDGHANTVKAKPVIASDGETTRKASHTLRGMEESSYFKTPANNKAHLRTSRKGLCY